MFVSMLLTVNIPAHTLTPQLTRKHGYEDLKCQLIARKLIN